jgi:serine/threonine-protein kinase PknG
MSCVKTPGCAGQLADGFCDVCGLAPDDTASQQASAMIGHSAAMSTPAGSSSQGRRSRRASASAGGTSGVRGNLGADLLDIPPVAYRDPVSTVQEHPEVPESKRFCSRCAKQVGRSRGGQPGRPEGFCKECGTAYSFVPKLKPGDLVAGQYEVLGCLAHGGLGWVYVARAIALDGMWVVLKGLLDTGDEEAMAAAISERRFLVEVEHPNIVHIINFVQHDSDGYIVMEYLGGKSLKEIRSERGAALQVADAVAYMLEALPALAYLHGRGLLYCDFKPDNIIQTEEQLKIIDLGGVRRMDDEASAIYGTKGFQAPEIAEDGPTVASDLYTVARTLAYLALDIPGFTGRYADTLPDSREVEVLERYPALHRFLLKGTHHDPSFRFQSADEMAEQLRGVLRQVLSLDTKDPHPALSKLFSPDLGSDPSETGWRDLPVPLPDASDPATALLSALAASTPEQLLLALASMPASAEVTYQRARALLESGEVMAARRALAADPDEEGDDWRSSWWLGVTELASGDHAAAAAQFEQVAAELPGELAPILALGLAHEFAGESRLACEEYGTVSLTDPSYVTGVFGLARVLSQEGYRRQAVTALRRVSAKSSAHQAAQAAIFSVLTSSSQSEPDPEDLVAAAATLNSAGGDPVKRAGMTRSLMTSALHILQGSPDIGRGLLLGNVRLEEASVRGALEQACRALAKLTPAEAERIRLIDEANSYRSRTLL